MNITPMSSLCNHPLGFSTTCDRCVYATRFLRCYVLVLTNSGWRIGV